jgi:hypothetical protein
MATDNVRDLREAREREGLDPDLGGASISERAANGQISEDRQTGLFDREVENETLERVLTQRQGKKERAAQAKKEFDDLDKKARVLIEELDLREDEVVRIGRFKISKAVIPGGHRSFDVGEQERLNIGVIKG